MPVAAPPLLMASTGDTLGAGAAATVIPAHEVEAEGAGGRDISFSLRKILLKFMDCIPVALSSRTVGGPSTIVIRFLSSAVTTSSINGAYPAS